VTDEYNAREVCRARSRKVALAAKRSTVRDKGGALGAKAKNTAGKIYVLFLPNVWIAMTIVTST